MTHYDEEALSLYALDRSLVDDPEGLEAHLSACAACRQQVEEAREFDALAGEEETWNDVAAMRARPPRLADAVAQRDVIVKEDLDARRRLEPYLKSPLRLRDKRLANDPRLITAGAVRILCVAAHAEHERRPRFSHALAVQACEIAKRLPVDHPARAECAVQAHCERANALRYLGKFKEADQVLAEAERRVPDTPVADFDLAIIQYIRACVWTKSERLHEALALARSSALTFRKYGDDVRELNALIVEGSCLSLLNEHAMAISRFERVVALSRRRGDLALLARGFNNMAASYTGLGDFDKASAYYSEAISLYEEAGIATEGARARWGLAGTLVARGELAAGIEALQIVRDELAARGLTNDAALATLEWAEACLAAGTAAGVAVACARIVMTFQSESMERNARVALAYLQEALAAGTATPQVVRHVRAYLEDLPGAPERAFPPAS